MSCSEDKCIEVFNLERRSRRWVRYYIRFIVSGLWSTLNRSIECKSFKEKKRCKVVSWGCTGAPGDTFPATLADTVLKTYSMGFPDDSKRPGNPVKKIKLSLLQRIGPISKVFHRNAIRSRINEKNLKNTKFHRLWRAIAKVFHRPSQDFPELCGWAWALSKKTRKK